MSSYTPKIGITCSFIPKQKTFIFNDYYNSIVKHGGVPYLIPVLSKYLTGDYEKYIEHYINNLDGFLFSGGGDLVTHNPKYRYGQKSSLYAQSRIRFKWEKDLLVAAIKSNRSILGICRGHQMLATYLGLKLTVFKQDHYEKSHFVYSLPNTHIEKILNAKKLIVNSYHKQCVMNNKTSLNNGFRVSLLSKENYVEGLENEKGNILSIQFHPEKMKTTQEIFDYFINSSRQS